MNEQTIGAGCEPVENEIAVMRQNMIGRLADTEAHFKHQMRGEPDLDKDEKCTIASALLEKSEGLFLERFSNYLSLEDIKCFQASKDDYLVNFYINKIKESCEGKNKNVIKNRRYQAVQEMMEEGDYFSEDKMQKRDPLLYEQLIGQYETEEEKEAKDVDKTDLRFSSILLKYMDKQEMKNHYEIMKEREEMQEEEEDEDSDEEEEDDDDEDHHGKMNKEGDDKNKSATVTDEERNGMRREYLQIMQERFLSGEDSQFDYSQVDSNSYYDSLALLNQDAEEKYFAEDDSNSMS